MTYFAPTRKGEMVVVRRTMISYLQQPYMKKVSNKVLELMRVVKVDAKGMATHYCSNRVWKGQNGKVKADKNNSGSKLRIDRTYLIGAFSSSRYLESLDGEIFFDESHLKDAIWSTCVDIPLERMPLPLPIEKRKLNL